MTIANGTGHQVRLVCGCKILAGPYSPLEISWCSTHLAATKLKAVVEKVTKSSFAKTRDEAPQALDAEMVEIVDAARAALAPRNRVQR